MPAVYTFKQFEGDVAAAVAKMAAAKGAKDHPLDGVFLSTNNLTFGVGALWRVVLHARRLSMRRL